MSEWVFLHSTNLCPWDVSEVIMHSSETTMDNTGNEIRSTDYFVYSLQ